MRGLKNIRLPHYDYQTDGYYFVTVVTKQRKNLLAGRESTVERILNDTITTLRGVSIDTKIIMPNHLHLILQLNSSALPLGEVIRRLKARISHALKQNVWQPNYYEHVVRDENALDRIREYILLNPQLEISKIDRFYDTKSR